MLEIRGEASDHAGAFASDSYNITSRPTTVATVAWAPPAWNTVGASGPKQQTPDLSAVVQEVVDRAGWASGNAMAFVLSGTGKRTAEAHAGGEPMLHITYASPDGTPPDDPAPPSPSPPPTGGLVAFPGAEGFGADAKGGRGGAVIKVTNLNDSGSGSLRACVEASGPRTCVFEVGGTIELDSRIKISDPYLTIAGQTAPGGGITIRNSASNEKGDTFLTATHDVVIRYIALRPGHAAGSTTTNRATSIFDSGDGSVYNVILDHISMSWASDDNSAHRRRGP